MKRRRMSSPNPPRFLTCAGTGGGSRSSENHFCPATSRGEQADQPKTAEYAFFQKLKEGGAHRFHSHPSHVERNQPEKFESHEDCRESYDVIHGSGKGGRSSVLIENVIAPKFNAFDSTVDTSLKKSDSPNIFVEQKSMEERRSAPDMRGAHGTSDVFSRKRENLLRQLRCTMSPEIEELSSKGCDVVSLLLDRLSGKIDEDNIYRTPATDQIRAAGTNHKPFAFDSDFYIEEFQQKPTKQLVEVEVGPFWGCGSSSTWTSGSRQRIPSVYDSPSAHGIVPWTEMKKVGYTSSENNIVPYAKSDSELDFQIEEGIAVSFSYPRNMEDFPHSDSNGPILKGESHTPLLQWNFDRDERDSLTIGRPEDVINDQSRSLDFWDSDRHRSIVEGLGTSGLPALPLDDGYITGTHFKVSIDEDLACEDVINDHSRSLDFLDSDHHQSIVEGLGTGRLPTLPLDDNSRIGTHFNVGINKDLAAFFSHMPITVSCFPSRFHLPEDWIHVHSSKVLSYQRPDEYEGEISTEQQHSQFGMVDSTSHSGFGSDSEWKLLLHWDSSSEIKLFLNQTLQFPREEKFVSSSFLGKQDWQDFMEGSL